MAKKVYVGNLSYGTTDSDLRRMFEEFGSVQSAQVIMDRESGRSKGFGFVEMGSDQEAQAAINALNGQEVDGRALTVNEAKPREDRGGRSGGGGRGGYGGGVAEEATAAADAIRSHRLQDNRSPFPSHVPGKGDFFVLLASCCGNEARESWAVRPSTTRVGKFKPTNRVWSAAGCCE